jgi:hypothetical protein
MSFAQRQGLHQAIAEWLEETYSEDLSPYYALLAYHHQKALGDRYGRSDLAAKTIKYLENAADRSLDNFANSEAVAFYSELLHPDDLTGNPADKLSRARWQRGLGEANFRMGERRTNPAGNQKSTVPPKEIRNTECHENRGSSPQTPIFQILTLT